MGEAAAHIRSAGKIVIHKHTVVCERQVIKAIAHVNPIGGEDIPDRIREIPDIHDLFCAVAHGLDKLRILAEHGEFSHFLTVGGGVEALNDPVREHQEVIDFLLFLRILFPNFVGDSADSVMQSDIDSIVCYNDPVRLRNRKPVDIHSLFIKELHLISITDKAGCKTARQVVFFQDKDIFDSQRLQLNGTAQAGDGTADNNDLVMIFVISHTELLSGFVKFLTFINILRFFPLKSNSSCCKIYA